MRHICAPKLGMLCELAPRAPIDQLLSAVHTRSTPVEVQSEGPREPIDVEPELFSGLELSGVINSSAWQVLGIRAGAICGALRCAPCKRVHRYRCLPLARDADNLIMVGSESGLSGPYACMYLAALQMKDEKEVQKSAVTVP